MSNNFCCRMMCKFSSQCECRIFDIGHISVTLNFCSSKHKTLQIRLCVKVAYEV